MLALAQADTYCRNKAWIGGDLYAQALCRIYTKLRLIEAYSVDDQKPLSSVLRSRYIDVHGTPDTISAILQVSYEVDT